MGGCGAARGAPWSAGAERARCCSHRPPCIAAPGKRLLHSAIGSRCTCGAAARRVRGAPRAASVVWWGCPRGVAAGAQGGIPQRGAESYMSATVGELVRRRASQGEAGGPVWGVGESGGGEIAHAWQSISPQHAARDRRSSWFVCFGLGGLASFRRLVVVDELSGLHAAVEK